MPDLNESVTFTVQESTTLSVPVDDTLSIEGQAADAAAVGRALAGKQDAGSVNVSVNGQEQDNQGQIAITGEDIPVDTTAGADNVADAIAGLQAQDAADITYDSTASSPASIKATVDALSGAVDGLQDDLDGLTAADITYDGTAATPESIKAKVDTLQATVTGIGNKTAADITYDGTASSPASIKATVDALQTTVTGIGNKTAADITYDGTASSPVSIKSTVDALQTTVAGIGTDSVKYSANQGLDATQQLNARNNIGAAAATDVTALGSQLPNYKDITYDNGGVYVSADGATNGGTTLEISWATLSLLPEQCKILGALLTWAWPMTEWTNGAIVTINNMTVNSTGVVLHLATTCSQNYMLRIRVLYMNR